MASCLGNMKQVQDMRFYSHLINFKEESFYQLTKTIAHSKGFLRK